jgi:hypothetical protein
MNSLIRPAIVVGIAGILGLLVLGLDLSCSPVNFWEVQQEREELRQLERATLDREEARQHLVREWMARRCTLTEVLTRFQELDQEWPDYTPRLAKMWLGEERPYQQILSTVEMVLQKRPEELAVVLHRLEKEYHQLQVEGQAHTTSSGPAGFPRSMGNNTSP